MKKIISNTLLVACSIFLIGCASTYKPISPTTLYYNAHDFDNGVGLSYKYDVLREKGNKKYSKKEEKKGVRLVAVKLTNNTDTTLNIGRDIMFVSGGNEIVPMDPMAVKSALKQIAPGYLPYLLLTFLQLNIGDGTSVDSYPIGIIVGPGVTFGNMICASSANTKMLFELNEYNINNRDIKKGETVYGIIGIKDKGYIPLSIKIRNN